MENIQQFEEMEHTLAQIMNEIVTVSRWLIFIKNIHSWDDTPEGFTLEKLQRTTLLVNHSQVLLQKLKCLKIKGNELQEE